MGRIIGVNGKASFSSLNYDCYTCVVYCWKATTFMYLIPKFDENWSNSGKVTEVLTVGVKTAAGVKIANHEYL